MDTWYGEQTRLTLENMSFSGVALSDFPAYLKALAQVKKACALANFRTGLLPEEKKESICAACDELIKKGYLEQFPVDAFHGGGGIGINMNMNEVIAAMAGHGVQPVDDVNLSQSTSDACHTALRLCLYGQLEELKAVLEEVLHTAEEKAKAFRPHPTVARTCWQDGLSVSAGAVWEGFAAALTEQKEWLDAFRPTLLRVNLGWTVIGTGNGSTEGYRAQIMDALGEVTGLFFSWKKSMYQAAQYTDDLSLLSAFVRNLSGILAKLARDVRLLSSGPETGLREWRVPAVQAGSSFFPGKVNPVIAEMMIQCDMLVGGNDSVIQNVQNQGEVHLNVWEELAGFLLIQNLMRLSKAAKLFNRRCLAGITLNEEVCRNYSRASIPLIADYKEKYGYKKLAAQVKQYGFEQTVENIRNGEVE